MRSVVATNLKPRIDVIKGVSSTSLLAMSDNGVQLSHSIYKEPTLSREREEIDRERESVCVCVARLNNISPIQQ